jgi:hypothetical protein
VTGHNAVALGGTPLSHWAFLPAPVLDELGAVRVRIYRPLQAGPDITAQRTWITGADGECMLVRELFRGDDRCIEEHWWPADAVPARLIPGEPEPCSVSRVVRPGLRDRRSAAAPMAASSPGDLQDLAPARELLVALSVALRDEPRRVTSVAASFRRAPADLTARTVRVSSGTEGRLQVDAEAGDGRQILRAAVWFGCG